MTQTVNRFQGNFAIVRCCWYHLKIYDNAASVWTNPKNYRPDLGIQEICPW